MLPTPDTSHVSFDTIYEPSEDSYLFLDTLSSASESAWLKERFSTQFSLSPSPLLLEVGSGSGIVISFLTANSHLILGRSDVLSLSTDVNATACTATRETVRKAVDERQTQTNITDEKEIESLGKGPKSTMLSVVTGDLTTPLRPGSVDILLFNPPYVPTEDLPAIPSDTSNDQNTSTLSRSAKFERESYYLSLTYAGGHNGMETTDRLLDAIPGVLEPSRGVAYVLLCAQNKPEEVKERIRGWEGGGKWRAESVGNSGVQAGWEKLVIVRIWREE
ncbi:S-adenosylmethionine-dependent methyltransferase [Aspergillus stella-maris]|uniref:S-adenosylmethionine-dependent methyltransferase n=1 Tax=Aspergillus stella-maris TaxID=1810926 RepID=UPI003CCD2A43